MIWVCGKCSILFHIDTLKSRICKILHKEFKYLINDLNFILQKCMGGGLGEGPCKNVLIIATILQGSY